MKAMMLEAARVLRLRRRSAVARSLGAVWAVASDEMPPEKLDAAGSPNDAGTKN